LELNVLYGIGTLVAYNPAKDKFICKKRSKNRTSNDDKDAQYGEQLVSHNPIHDIIFHRILPRSRVSILPSGVTSNYYSFMKWRIIQRFVNANLHVFGTQSMLLALGIKANMNSRLGALSAAMN
jgi:Vitamin B6 photo-protection and homoeostasis